MPKPKRPRATKAAPAPAPAPEKKAKLRAPRVRLHVNRVIIDSACRNDSAHCMIADTIKAQVPTASRVSVDLQTIRWSDTKKGLRYTYLTPRLAQEALVRFDRGLKIPEFALPLRGAQVTTALVGKKGEQKPRHKLGRRRINPLAPGDQRAGFAPETIGGKPPPRLRAAAHSHTQRRFGIKAFTLDDVVPEE